jgi:hypothetical protein
VKTHDWKQARYDKGSLALTSSYYLVAGVCARLNSLPPSLAIDCVINLKGNQRRKYLQEVEILIEVSYNKLTDGA